MLVRFPAAPAILAIALVELTHFRGVLSSEEEEEGAHMPRTHAAYSPEFLSRMIELARAGRTPEELAQQFDAIGRRHLQLGEPGRPRPARASEERIDDGGERRGPAPTPGEQDPPLKSAKILRKASLTGSPRENQVDPVQGFEFVRENQADDLIATMCRVLGVSASGYYAWHRRAPSARAQVDAKLTMTIHTIHIESRGTYGGPRVHAELAAQGTHVGGKRVARLMRAAKVQGVSRRKQIFTTKRDPAARPGSRSGQARLPGRRSRSPLGG